jgi:hypothetical protein
LVAITLLFILIGALCIVALLQLVLHLGLYLGMRQDFFILRRENTSDAEYLRAECERLTAELAALSADVAALKPSPVSLLRSGQPMNLSRRNQILRMHIRGDSPDLIAKTLQIGRGEVDLLLKVHRTLSESIRSASAARAS